MSLVIISGIIYVLFSILSTRWNPLTIHFTRWLIAIIFVFLTLMYLGMNTVNWLHFVVLGCIILSGEIAYYKTNANDYARVFLVHTFTILLLAGFIILLFNT